MPYKKIPRKKQPLWKDWDYKAQKKGVRNTVYSVNGDEFTGEWLDNKKHGESSYFSFFLIQCSHHRMRIQCTVKQF